MDEIKIELLEKLVWWLKGIVAGSQIQNTEFRMTIPPLEMIYQLESLISYYDYREKTLKKEEV